jgi:hypothetical protein
MGHAWDMGTWLHAPIECIEAERRVLCDDGTTHSLCSELALFGRNFQRLALQLRQVNLLVGQHKRQRASISVWRGLGEEELDFLELLGIPGDKGDEQLRRRRRHGQEGEGEDCRRGCRWWVGGGTALEK